MKLIDADTLVKEVCKISCNKDRNACPHINSYFETGCKTVIAIENAPTIDAMPIHWTNIDEAMPEIGVMVLMHRPPKFTAVMSLKYFDERFWWENHRREITEAYDNDYWMPLPEPPKEVEVE